MGRKKIITLPVIILVEFVSSEFVDSKIIRVISYICPSVNGTLVGDKSLLKTQINCSLYVLILRKIFNDAFFQHEDPNSLSH
jgi:hypothetical protein